MRTHKLCFCREIRKMLRFFFLIKKKNALSGAMIRLMINRSNKLKSSLSKFFIFYAYPVPYYQERFTVEKFGMLLV